MLKSKPFYYYLFTESGLFLVFDKNIELSGIGFISNIRIDYHTKVEKIIKIFNTISLCKSVVQ